MCTGSVFVAGLLAISPLSKTATANSEGDPSFSRFTVEVYLDGKTARGVSANPNEPPNTFEPGDIGYIEGVLYPKGTLHSGPSDPAPGTPTIGTFRYRGVATISLQDYLNALGGDLKAP